MEDPVQEMRDPRVHAGVARLGASVPKTEINKLIGFCAIKLIDVPDNADEEPAGGVLLVQHERAAAVPLAGVPPAVRIARAQEHLRGQSDIT